MQVGRRWFEARHTRACTRLLSPQLPIGRVFNVEIALQFGAGLLVSVFQD